MEQKKFVCCFCGGVFEGYGNNPWPANKTEGAVCCNDCNSLYVIPARLEAMFEKKGEE